MLNFLPQLVQRSQVLLYSSKSLLSNHAIMDKRHIPNRLCIDNFETELLIERDVVGIMRVKEKGCFLFLLR